MNDFTASMYQENILDHNKHPRNFGQLSHPTFSYKHHNPTCGDAFTIQVSIKDECIQEVAFYGEGCAISTASMSLFSEKIHGMKVVDVLKLEKQDVEALLGIEITPARETCAQLSRITVQQGLKNYYE